MSCSLLFSQGIWSLAVRKKAVLVICCALALRCALSYIGLLRSRFLLCLNPDLPFLMVGICLAWAMSFLLRLVQSLLVEPDMFCCSQRSKTGYGRKHDVLLFQVSWNALLRWPCRCFLLNIGLFWMEPVVKNEYCNLLFVCIQNQGWIPVCAALKAVRRTTYWPHVEDLPTKLF
jgi:hypothetical protein